MRGVFMLPWKLVNMGVASVDLVVASIPVPRIYACENDGDTNMSCL